MYNYSTTCSIEGLLFELIDRLHANYTSMKGTIPPDPKIMPLRTVRTVFISEDIKKRRNILKAEQKNKTLEECYHGKIISVAGVMQSDLKC